MTALRESDLLDACEGVFDITDTPAAFLLATYCTNGHERTPENTAYYSDGALGKRRVCRTCQRESDRRRAPTPDVKPAHLEGLQRKDALPEYSNYADTGCGLAPSCLSCPLERCRYDLPQGLKSFTQQGKASQVLALRAKGEMIETIAQRVGISRRTVFRYLAEQRGDVPATLGRRPALTVVKTPPTTAPRNAEAIRAAVEGARRALRVLEALRA